MRSRRSCLSVPGSSPKMLAKAHELPADEIVIDLEDAVSPDSKEDARAAVIDELRGGDFDGRTVSVRVNATDSPWFSDDVTELVSSCGATLATLIVPKVERPADLERAAELVAGAGGDGGPGLQALIETARGVRDLATISTAAGGRLETLIVGYADLAASLGRSGDADYPGDPWHHVRSSVLIAARAEGLQAIDGPYLAIRDLEGLRASAESARALGYDGKWALHPSQVEPLNELFAPSQDELDRAAAVVEALERAEGRGAVMLDGEMIDEATRKLAASLLERGAAAGLAPSESGPGSSQG